MLKTILIYVVFLFGVLLFVSRCVIYKKRIHDSKAYRIFADHQVPFATYDTVIGGRHMHYAIAGIDSLPLLVFIHGSPGSWYRFMFFMYDPDMLKKFRMMSIDRPGYGFSDFGKVLRLDEQEKLIMQIVEKLKNEKPIYLCGHSYGGALVCRMAADNPGYFKTLIIAAGAIDPELEKPESWRYLIKNKPLFWLIPGAFQPSNTELLFLKKDLDSLAPYLSRITCQVCFIHGDKDGLVPIEEVAYGKKMLVNASSMRIDTLFGAGHKIIRKNVGQMKKIFLELVNK
ncbi:MAG TPA: alpha/beta hydrolase [Chitinophagaceae bacterium]|nr:alpha/beta hydrolase [Chitinophagaceae bacterium]